MKWASIAAVLGLLFVTSSAQAQSVDFVYGAGRAFDIPSASWMNFHAPGLEVSAKGFVFNVTRLFDTSLAKSETDLTGSYSYQYKRLKVSLTGAKWYYHMPFTYTESRKSDYRVWVEGRYTIYKR